MGKTIESSVFLRSFWLRISCLPLLLGFAVFGACSDTTDPVPEPEDLSFQYLPDTVVVTMRPGEFGLFSVACTPDVTLDAEWKLNSEVVSTEKGFRFDATHVGIDTLRLETSYSSVSWDRSWYIDIIENEATVPPDVPSIAIEHGSEASDVKVNWRIISQSTYPIVEYQIAMSYDGPITAANWSGAVLLGAFPHLENQIGYSETFSQDEDGMIPGETVWFSVRGLDEAGQLSRVDGVYSHQISFEWFIEGYVYGDDGRTLSEVIIDYGCESCRVATTSEGFFRIGPLPNVNTYELRTETYDYNDGVEPFNSFYDITVSDVQYDPNGNYDIVLIARYGLDEGCSSYDLEYMNYFRDMTNTFHPTALRPDHLLYKWDNYPVPVYVPPFINEHGLDFQILSQEVVSFWNLAMGEDYLVLVDMPAEVGIEFEFGGEGAGSYYGSTTLTKPDNENYHPGDVIPEVILVYIWDQIAQEVSFQEIVMHELGHALGLHEHTLCGGEGFLMATSPFGALANGPENAVHQDEKRAIRTIRNLPQATDILSFELE